MSLQSQIRNMKLLGEILSGDLGYIFGERESGPKGAKKQFLSTGRAFLAALGKDLGFKQQKAYSNKAGIAVSGEVCLRGMWGDAGLKAELSQDFMGGRCLRYRRISDMKDTSGGYTHYITLLELKAADYVGLLEKLLSMDGGGAYGRKAA